MLRLSDTVLGAIARPALKQHVGVCGVWIEAVGVESLFMAIKKSYVWSRITRTILLRGLSPLGWRE